MNIFVSKSEKNKLSLSQDIIDNLNIKYKKIINNLLNQNIQVRDPAIFSKLNKTNLDLTKIFSTKNLDQIYKKADFKIEIEENIKIDFEDLDLLKNAEEVINYFEDNEILLKNYEKEILNTDFKLFIDKYKKTIINDKNNFLNKWKKIIFDINNYYNEKNIWPFYIGTFFLKSIDDTKNIRAPLILKQVKIEINNNKVFLISEDSGIILNEKLIFELEKNFNFQFPTISDIKNVSLKDACEEMFEFIKPVIYNKSEFFDIINKFENKNIKDEQNTSLILDKGIITILFNPLGGKLKEVIIELIKSGKIDNIVELDSTIDYESIGIEKLKNQESIARIVPTDSSQEKTILTALENSLIIIGPPGTGKSQVIANIIVNIINNQKKALFIAEKKVALDVVLKRLKNLSKFCFQFSNNSSKKISSMEKDNFYTPIEIFFNDIKIKSKDINELKKTKFNLQAFYKTHEIQYNTLKEKIKAKEIEQIQLSSFFVNYFQNNLPENIDNNLINKLYTIKNCISEFDSYQIFQEFIYTKLNKKKFAESKNMVKSKFLFFNDYDSNFQKWWSLTRKIIEQVNFEISEKLYNNLKKIHDPSYINNFLKLLDTNDNYLKICNSSNRLKNNNKEIIDLIEENLTNYLKFKLIQYNDKKELNKIYGRLNTKFGHPNKFIKLFNKTIKHFYNIFVGTPEFLANFLDFEKDQFDYVIFDEASQIFIEKALPFISLGKIIIVAGDDKQLQPTNWFKTRQESNELDLDQEEFRENTIDSLLEWAKLKGFPEMSLEMNYRSNNAELVTFSSKHFYNSNLKTLDKKNYFQKNAIEVIDLVDGEWDNGINIKEANLVMDILRKNINKFEEIIILTFNSKQRNYLNDLIINEKDESLYEKLNNTLWIKNIENIQGDEADLIIATLSYTKKTKLSGTYVVNPNSSGRNALNVAITRAREKMIVVKSIKGYDVKIDEYSNQHKLTFKNWLEFLEKNSIERKNYAIKEVENNADVESNFEKNVLENLRRLKFVRKIQIKNQFSVGSYRIDIVLIDELSQKFLLGIEVDGLLYHNGFEKMNEDRKRQDFIESKGFPIYRITEIEWIHKKEKVMSEIVRYINSQIL